VIGDKAEDAFRQSMLMSQGSLGIFVGNKLVTTLIVGGFALLLLPPLFRTIGVWRNARR
jgi:putative tricarboxylic transport membrane protein